MITDQRRVTVQGLAHAGECADSISPPKGRERRPRGITREPLLQVGTVSAGDLMKVLGAVAAKEILRKVWAAKQQPLTDEQLDTLISFCEGTLDTAKGPRIVPAMRILLQDKPGLARQIVEWAIETKATGGVPGGIPPHLRDEEPQGQFALVATNNATPFVADVAEPVKLNDRQRKVVKYLQRHPNGKVGQMAEALEMPSSTVNSALEALRRRNVVVGDPQIVPRGVPRTWRLVHNG